MAVGNLRRRPFRPGGMWKRILALAALLSTAACGATNAGNGVACTAIGSLVGVGVDVAHPDVASGTLEVCWDGTCATPALELHPSSRVAETTCTGTAPQDSCGARMEPTAGKNGFATIPELPARSVTATLRLLDGSGSVLVDRQLPLTPEVAYPNGRDCPPGGPQAGISVGVDGAVTER